MVWFGLMLSIAEKAKESKTRYGEVRQGPARSGQVRRGGALLGWVGRGLARHGTVGQGVVFILEAKKKVKKHK